ncbi:hypothetical protein PPERSA_05882 [Pseudocohnilembus persalinus]|uniref:NAD(P)-binding domain n=1 Tax=Pseudocohnilembus persalinus TaxID=266149 RepID=A0A0V0R3Z8_PSEPJ|nr:hypothetical protein PPERSA_05882 [Pseudocohnilembus persalinus]|eukprot:KRX09213.1 hypothetical protein PPERSA_05882 [Pseudocohnilembus persalinus]
MSMKHVQMLLKSIQMKIKTQHNNKVNKNTNPDIQGLDGISDIKQVKSPTQNQEINKILNQLENLDTFIKSLNQDILTEQDKKVLNEFKQMYQYLNNKDRLKLENPERNVYNLVKKKMDLDEKFKKNKFYVPEIPVRKNKQTFQSQEKPTGASSGIGLEMAKQLAELGAILILSSRNKQSLEEVKQKLKNSDKHFIVPLDLSQPKDVLKKTKEFMQNLENQLNQKIDIVIENAGSSQRCFFKDMDLESHDYLMNLNLNGPVAHCKGIVDHFIKNKSGQFVIMNSVQGKIAPGMRCSYSASKHAIAGFFDSLRAELSEYNIKVTQLYPGYVKTNLSKNALIGNKDQKFGKTDENNAKGMDVQQFVKEALYNIYKQETEVIISNNLSHHLGPIIKQFFPNLMAHYMNWYNKKQIKAILKAQ